MTKRNWSVSIDHRILKLKQVIVGWVNYRKHEKSNDLK
ncbi:group II intron maturase-specific domain-containing protein [Robertmurraya sp. P23]